MSKVKTLANQLIALGITASVVTIPTTTLSQNTVDSSQDAIKIVKQDSTR